MNKLYKEIGISKQAVSQYVKRQKVFDYNVHNHIVEAEELRKEHPGCGVEKMYYTLRPDFIGRDNFIDLFMSLGFRIKKNKNYRRTTFASRVNYPNCNYSACNLAIVLKANKMFCPFLMQVSVTDRMMA